MKEKNTKEENMKNPPKYRNDNSPNATPGINSPDIALPEFNPPVPNRAWTEMRKDPELDELSEEEKRNLYFGRSGGI